MRLQFPRCLRHTVTALCVLGVMVLPATANADELPQLVTDPTVTGTVVSGTPVDCSGAVFTGDNLTYAYDWKKLGVGPVGAPSQTYIPTRSDIGYEIVCHVTASNAAGSAEGFSKPAPVEDGAPVNTTPPKVTGKAVPGVTATCSTGAWNGAPTSYAYQWLVNDKPVAGATSNKLLLLDAFHDKTVVCRVTASNASGAATSSSRAIVPFHPEIQAPFAKVQPKLPKLAAALRSGITSKLVCNASCATETHLFILTSDARRYGIAGKDLGGLTIVGIGHAKRTFAGELLVTTKFSASAKRGLAKAKSPVRVDILAETAWGPKYSFKLLHQAESKTVKLKR